MKIIIDIISTFKETLLYNPLDNFFNIIILHVLIIIYYHWQYLPNFLESYFKYFSISFALNEFNNNNISSAYKYSSSMIDDGSIQYIIATIIEEMVNENQNIENILHI